MGDDFVNSVLSKYAASEGSSVSTREKVIKELSETWSKYPSLRLGQLLCIVVREGKRQFHITDEELCELLENFRLELP
jgi:hypothetical protein